MIKISTFCSGIGSPEFGFEELSQELDFKYENVFACEIDANARKSYLANHNPTNMLIDMTKYDYKRSDIFQKKDKFYSDINVAGLPCQAFSIAGRRMGEMDDRGILFFDYYRWIDNQRPKVFIIENVKGLLSIEKGTVFQNWLHLLGNSVNGHRQMFNHPDSLGYNLHYTTLNTKHFGIPQNRERVFIVGIRNDLPNDFRFPKGFSLKLRLKDILEKNVDEKYYLSEKAIKSIILNKENLQKPNINPDVASTIQCPGNSCGTYKGANFISEPNIIQINTKNNWGDSVKQQNRVYDDSGIMACVPAARTESKVNIRTDSRIRRLTPLETWRLQGLKDEYFNNAKNSGIADTHLYKQSGNSMTKHVIKAIIKNTLHLLQ